MKLLLDTCVFIWLAAEPAKLSRKARAALDDQQNDLMLSDVSVLEICLKWHAGKLQLPTPPRAWVEANRTAWALSRLPLQLEHLYRVTELPDRHRDPFDRLLISQALADNLTIVTPDPAIAGYPVASVW